jgi:hypothetical protein
MEVRWFSSLRNASGAAPAAAASASSPVVPLSINSGRCRVTATLTANGVARSIIFANSSWAVIPMNSPR